MMPSASITSENNSLCPSVRPHNERGSGAKKEAFVWLCVYVLPSLSFLPQLAFRRARDQGGRGIHDISLVWLPRRRWLHQKWSGLSCRGLIDEGTAQARSQTVKPVRVTVVLYFYAIKPSWWFKSLPHDGGLIPKADLISSTATLGIRV